MYYELYIDVLFLVNFMMDCILLLVTRRMLKCSATHARVFIGALTGSILTCLVIALPIPSAFVKFILFHGVVNVVMIKAGLGIKWDKTFIKAYLLLYISGFLVGGVFEYLHQYLKIGSLFFAFAIASYYIVLGIWNLISYLAKVNQYKCEALLYKDGKVCSAQALIDTGNCLRDGVTGKPVSIVDEEIFRELYHQDNQEGIRYIPYHSVGKKEGVMRVITIDRLCVRRKEECWVEKPLIAASEENITDDGAYKMIINPDIL